MTTERLVACLLALTGTACFAISQAPPRPPVRTATPPINRGLPPKVKAPRSGWGSGPNIRQPEEAKGPAGVVRTPVKPAGPKAAQSAQIRSLVRRLEKKSPLRPVEIVWGLESPIGRFDDIDGDGEMEFLGVRATKERTTLSVYVQRNGTWRYLRGELAGLRGSKPAPPWVLSDDGKGKASILIPAARPPYLYQVFLTKRGGLDLGRVRSLERFLPKRVRKDDDYQPYTISKITPGKKDVAARVEGVLRERTAPGKFEERAWTIEILGTRVRPSSLPAKPATGVRDLLAERTMLWQDFNGDGRTDVLAAVTTKKAKGREHLRLSYGAGKEKATLPVEVATLVAQVPDPRKAVRPFLSFVRSEQRGEPLWAIYFRPWQVGVFLRGK